MKPTKDRPLSLHLRHDAASYWLGLFRNFATISWSIADFLIIPFVILLIAKVGIPVGLSVAGYIVGFVSAPLLLAAHLESLRYWRLYLPRRIRLDLEQGMIVVQTSSDNDSAPLTECRWTFGRTTSDTIGQFLRDEAAVLIQLPWTDVYLQDIVVSIPARSGADQWEAALKAHQVPQFQSERVYFGIKRPSPGSRIFTRGVAIGLFLGYLIDALVTFIVGRPIWPWSIYGIAVIASCQAVAVYWSLGKLRDVLPLPTAWQITLGSAMTSALIGLVVVGEKLDPRGAWDPTGAGISVALHIMVGVAVTWLFVVITRWIVSVQERRQAALRA